jgi:rubrerythrin
MSEANKAKLKDLTTVRDIFETATEFERTAHMFYTDLVPKVSKNIRYLVIELAEEELGHIKTFTDLAKNPDVEAVMAEKIARPVADGKFSDCIQLPEMGDDPDDQEVLQYALMRESAAAEQYAELAESAPEGRLKEAFRFLANEELEHKAELEAIYYKIVHSGGV